MGSKENCVHCEMGSHSVCVSMVPIFSGLDEEHLREVMKTIQSVSYKNGEIIYHDGDPSDSLYIVKEGRIKDYRLSESGKEQLIRILNPGDFTGANPLFNHTLHNSFAEAMGDTQVCLINRLSLQDLLMKFPAISYRMLAELSKRLENSEKQTTRFTTERVETRLALFLVECLDGNGKSKEFELPMCKRDLASYIGTTPETLSRKLTDLEEAGFIGQKAHKRIEILDLDNLLLV